MNNVTKIIVRAGVIAALYATLCIAFFFSSFATATIQFRVSEALTVLPLFFPEAIIGLWIGCILGNLVSGNVIDIFFGSGATLIAAALTFLIGMIVRRRRTLRIILGAIPPVLVNAFLVPMTFTLFIGAPEMYIIQVLWVFIGQAAVLAVLGVPFAIAVEKRLFRHELRTRRAENTDGENKEYKEMK